MSRCKIETLILIRKFTFNLTSCTLFEHIIRECSIKAHGMNVSKICLTKAHYYSVNNHVLQQVDSSPYLGVTITHDLKWTTHIKNITRKTSCTLGFLRRNLRFCPSSCRKTAYISLVYSTLEYSAVVWDPSQLTDIDKLENIQKRAARFITQNDGDRTPECVTNMLSDLGLQPPQEKCSTATYLLRYDTLPYSKWGRTRAL